jgi:hypothetical protein
MTCCLVSNRPFADGPLTEPILENDPVNMAWVLGGEYLSFLTVRRLSDSALRDRLSRFDPVIVALDRDDIGAAWRVAEASSGKLFTYSEGHIWGYQGLAPEEQSIWAQMLERADRNLIYWERFLPFFGALSKGKVSYLPYPYLVDQARAYRVQPARRSGGGIVPTGLAGETRNGLVNVLVARQLREAGSLVPWSFCLDAGTFDEDAAAVTHLLGLRSVPRAKPRLSWTEALKGWMVRSGVDYRKLAGLYGKARRVLGDDSTGDRLSWMPTPDLTFVRRTGWGRYLQHLAQAQLMVDLNNRETVGRNALDCAALGVPCVSTPLSDLQPRLFPETTVSHAWAIDEAVDVVGRLLDDRAFYDRVCDHAASGLAAFGPDAFRRRYQEAVERGPGR